MSDRMQTSSSVSGTLGAIRPTAGMSAPQRQHEIVVLAKYRGGLICIFRSSIFFLPPQNAKISGRPDLRPIRWIALLGMLYSYLRLLANSLTSSLLINFMISFDGMTIQRPEFSSKVILGRFVCRLMAVSV